ncbi:MFS transporter [Pseudomonas extremaustralis]|uniref:MFS transporter n=1 Tax=Pseudomonas extremaustralis TaxID=359110 RepID=UPI0028624BA3|nr:MFS transporter [Pseudomonas extremaustralis]MDR6575874.1 MFS family permease [Pseudomonas extremaustralis]
MNSPNKPSIRTLLTCNLGVCLEGFDFIAYSFFSFIIGKQFFPSQDPLNQSLLVLGSFGVAYLMRPLGGIFWGLFADRHGRRAALVWISVSMAMGVALIAFTPGYATIGITAPIVIICARLLQGFSAGGEFASATAMLAECAPPGHKGFYCSTQMASQVITVGLTSALILLMTRHMDPLNLESWGWRAVFAFGILIGPVGFYMRAKMAESPAFLNLKKTVRQTAKPSLNNVLRDYRWEVMCTAGISAIGAGAFYLIMIFLPIYAGRELGFSREDAQLSVIVSCFVQFFACLGAGALSDRIGIRRVMLTAAMGYMVMAYPLFIYLIGHPTLGVLLVVQALLSLLLGFISGPLPAALSGLFPTEIRSSGIGIIYNLIGAIFGGLGPFLVTTMISFSGDLASPAYWAVLTGILGCGALYCLRFAGTSRTADPTHPLVSR